MYQLSENLLRTYDVSLATLYLIDLQTDSHLRQQDRQADTQTNMSTL